MSESTNERTTTDVRVWEIDKRSGGRGVTYRLRWRTSDRRHTRTFTTKKLADTFRSALVAATARGEPFDVPSGLPVSQLPSVQAPTITWLEHAREYLDVKWPAASARHRKGMAEALTNITVALVSADAGPVDHALLRRALNHYTFNTAARAAHPEPPESFADALRWIAEQSLPVMDLSDPAVARRALAAVSRKLDGSPAAPSTVARKRATLTNALHHAVELKRLPANPLTTLRTQRTQAPGGVDRRVVVNPAQATALLAAVRQHDPALEAFFASVYYAALRPAEARQLLVSDCKLPTTGWGEATLAGSKQYAGGAWTDSGEADENRGLKHRHRDDVRPVPLHPVLVATLRRHIDDFGTGVGGRLFVARTGRAGTPLPPPYAAAVSPKTIYRAWSAARTRALTPEQVASPLGRRPYDLRHACVSTWLNAGVPAAQVAAWAGHSTSVLLKVYAKCVDGAEAAAMAQIEAATETGQAP